jgi:hypothetical protein
MKKISSCSDRSGRETSLVGLISGWQGASEEIMERAAQRGMLLKYRPYNNFRAQFRALPCP